MKLKTILIPILLTLVPAVMSAEEPDTCRVTSFKGKNAVFVFDSAGMELIKDSLYISFRYRMPDKKVYKDSRMVIQPCLYNRTAADSMSVMLEADSIGGNAYEAAIVRSLIDSCCTTELDPVVYDGKNYSILIRRGQTCGQTEEERGKYTPYARDLDKKTYSDTLAVYRDICRIENPDELYATRIAVSVSAFCHKLFADTVNAFSGITYPMRMFDLSVASYDLGDEYAPEQEVLNFQESGEVNLSFRVNDANIYESDGNNGRELRNFRKMLDGIEKNPTKELSVFNIYGYSSPEGSLEHNAKLASERMKSAVEAILKNISKESLGRIEVKYGGVVTPWDSVSEHLKRDGEILIAADLEALMASCGHDHDEISKKIRYSKHFPFIRTYLPRFRRVEYTYRYTELRSLNIEEITDLYNRRETLTGSEYWRYLRSQRNLSPEELEALLREALEQHPDLMIAANNLAVMLNRDNRADTTLLLPFLNDDAPVELKINHAVALLQKRDFARGEMLVAGLPADEPAADGVRAIVKATNGHYEEAYKYFGRTDDVNKAVLLLCMRRDGEAWETMQRCEGVSARDEYVRAMAANRLGKTEEAVACLKRALELEPDLADVAKVDADVLNLMDLMK